VGLSLGRDRPIALRRPCATGWGSAACHAFQHFGPATTPSWPSSDEARFCVLLTLKVRASQPGDTARGGPPLGHAPLGHAPLEEAPLGQASGHASAATRASASLPKQKDRTGKPCGPFGS